MKNPRRKITGRFTGKITKQTPIVEEENLH